MVDTLVARVGSEVVGDGLEPEVTMGPVHRPAARQRVGHVGGGRRARCPCPPSGSGARGGRRRRRVPGVSRHRRGCTRRTPRSCARSRRNTPPAFCPGDRGISRIVDDAVAAPTTCPTACARPSGPPTTIWRRARHGRLQAGTVFVNNHGTSAMDHRAPFGGWKQSGYGLELGPEGMLAFTRPKTILQILRTCEMTTLGVTATGTSPPRRSMARRSTCSIF